MKYIINPKKKNNYLVSKKIHSVFFEFFGRVIYDGIWVGRDSEIPNTDGIRNDVIDGCKEIGIGSMRWPGGCCADHYHWKNGVGKIRENRTHPIPDPANPVWRNDFGTDEFLRFCELTNSEPVLTVNTATGSPEEFLDWYEYVNGGTETKYGKLRAENGHPEPYNVKYWGIGNTDENVWHIDYNNPVAYAQTYLKYQTVIRGNRKSLYFIGLGLSTRHRLPGWAGKSLDHITRNQRDAAPDALSIHHYLGGAKQGGEMCGGDVDFSDDNYYALLSLLDRYQYDIDLHRFVISEHTREGSGTKICFDEWGAWHPQATFANNQNQIQTMRDGIFAALTLHIFYRNSDIVEFAMETQLSNLLQSLFETDGAKFYKTPTFYIMKLFRQHAGQFLTDIFPSECNNNIDTVATISEDEREMTISIVNKSLCDDETVAFSLPDYNIVCSEIVTCADIHDRNSFENPEKIHIETFKVETFPDVSVPKHSVIKICLKIV